MIWNELDTGKHYLLISVVIGNYEIHSIIRLDSLCI